MKDSRLGTGVPRNLQRTTCAEKHDRLGWTSGSAFLWRNLRIGLRTNEPSLLSRLESYLPGGSVRTEETGVDILVSLRVGQVAKRRGQTNYHLVYHAWDRVVRTLDLEEAVVGFRELLHERCALQCSEPLFVRGSLARTELGTVALHGRVAEQAAEFVGDLPGYISASESESFRAVLLASQAFAEPAELTAGQAVVRALNLNLVPYFLADAAGCMHRLSAYFSKARIYGVPEDFQLSDLPAMLAGGSKEENRVASKR